MASFKGALRPISLRNNKTVLAAHGLYLDKAGYLKKFSSVEKRTDMDTVLCKFHMWRELLNKVKGDEREALCRTLTVNQGVDHLFVLKALAEPSIRHFPEI
jgi:hypothetical protein